MNFFKRLFSSDKRKGTNPEETNFQGIYSDTYFTERYTEQNITDNPEVLDGCLKMVGSYFIDNKIERKVEKPINHPLNLDQVVDEGMGFQLYCKAFRLEDTQTTMFLAIAFSHFLTTHYDFKMYKDNKPELPLRSMTLKYDKNGVVLSLYPFEYSLKVLNNESTFTDLYTRIKSQVESMPNINEILKKFPGSKEGEN